MVLFRLRQTPLVQTPFPVGDPTVAFVKERFWTATLLVGSLVADAIMGHTFRETNQSAV